MLTLDAGSGDEAQASESIEATVDGEAITTGFNPQFLLDGLTAIDEAVVELAFTQASKPVVLSGAIGDGDEDPGFRYLLMPGACYPEAEPTVRLAPRASPEPTEDSCRSV